jgi:hypothetical protein
VTLGALADRYDHEYFWGVSLCAWFWHALGIVWVCILIVFVISTGTAKDMGRQDSAPTRGMARLVLRSSVPVRDLIHSGSAVAALLM